MPFDMTIDELTSYHPAVSEPHDFDAFWNRSLQEAARHPLNPVFEPFDSGLSEFEVFDVQFAGWDGNAIKGWLILPSRPSDGPRPLVVSYIGYGSGRGFPHQWLPFAGAGWAVMVMDTRGQGSEDLPGATADGAPGRNPQVPGFVTNGILNEDHYYYRRLLVDAVRAVDCARAFPGMAESAVVVHGVSQGGGIALAVSALRDDLAGAFVDVPFMTQWERGVDMAESGPYLEINNYLATHRDHDDRVFGTLSYFDGVNFAKRSQTRTRYSVALNDRVCPPSTVFAAYNHHAGEREMRIWRFNGHEGGEGFNVVEQLQWLRDLGLT